MPRRTTVNQHPRKRKTKAEKEAEAAAAEAEAQAARARAEAEAAEAAAAAARAELKAKRQAAARKGAETRRRKAAAKKSRDENDGLDADDVATLRAMEARQRLDAIRANIRAKHARMIPEYTGPSAPEYLKHVPVYRSDTPAHHIPAHVIRAETYGKRSKKFGQPKDKWTADLAYVKPQAHAKVEAYVSKRSNFAKWFGL